MSSKGDPAKTGRLRNRARILVQQLINQIKAPPFNGVGQQSRSWRGDNGEAIHVMVNMVGLAPIIRAWVESPTHLVAETEVLSGLLFIESGMLYLHREDQEDYLPFTIYVGGTLSQHFASGTVVPGRKPPVFFQGRMEFDSSGFTVTKQQETSAGRYLSAIFAEKTTRDDFKELLRLLEIERQVGGVSPLTPYITQSSNYSGLMRKGVQAWLGAGRLIGSCFYISTPTFDVRYFIATKRHVCPFPYVEPLNDGLIHDENYNFWWVRIDNRTVTFKELASSAPWFIKNKLKSKDSGLSDGAKEKYMLILLSGLSAKTDGRSIVVNISNYDDFAGGGRVPLSYGFHFNYKSPWKATITTFMQGPESTHNDWYLVVTRGEFDFSFSSDGTPTATASVVESKECGLPAIWYAPVDASFMFWPVEFDRTYRHTEYDIPVYAFYDKNNTLVIARYKKATPTPEEISPPGQRKQPCGYDVSEETFKYGTLYKEGDTYSVGDQSFSVSSLSGHIAIVKQYSEYSRTWTCGYPCAGGLAEAVSAALQAAIPEDSIKIEINGQVDHEMAFRYVESSGGPYSEVTRCTMIIPIGDAEAVYIGSDTDAYTAGDMLKTVVVSNSDQPAKDHIYGFYTWNSQNIRTYIELGVSGCRSDETNGYLSLISEEWIDPIQEHKGDMLLVTSQGTFPVNATYPAWSRFAINQDNAIPTGAYASLAASACGYYVTDPKEGEYEMLDGAANVHSKYRLRWIGDA
jgi:hypothetical protein